MARMRIKLNYKQELSKILAQFTELQPEEITIETPPDKQLGDMAFPCFRLAKAWKKAPPIIAKELAEKILNNRPNWLSGATAEGPYINFHLERTVFTADIINAVLLAGEKYGSQGVRANNNSNRKILVEYSSPNIAKQFHVGHLGSTIIGRFLDNVYRFLGYDVISINHLGDWGTQFGKLITAYLKWGSREEIEKTEIEGLTKLYVRFHKEAKDNPSLDDEARSWVVKMQDGDKEGLEILKWFVELSMREYERLYKRMDISFDLIRGESFFSDKMDAVAESISNKGLLKDSDGAKIVDLEEYNMPPCLILRSDGGTLYPTRDIAAAIHRYEEYKFEKCLYVTGNEQALHFAQWMKVVELMGNTWASGLVHIPYGMLLFKDGKISTREGNVIKIEELMDNAVAKALELIEEKNPTLANKIEVSEQVGIGAMIFNRLYNSRMKDSMFDFDRAISFEGETGPYVQYTHARACSVLGKAKTQGQGLELVDNNIHAESLIDDKSFDVLRLLYDYPAIVEESAEKYEPFLVSRHLIAVAQAFNAFYHEHIILVDDQDLRQARLALTEAVRYVLKSGLSLLGIKAPVAM